MRKDSSRNETRISSRLVEYPDRVVDSFQDGIGQSIPSITMKPRKKKCFLDRVHKKSSFPFEEMSPKGATFRFFNHLANHKSFM